MQKESETIQKLTKALGIDGLASLLIIILTLVVLTLYARTLDRQSLWFDEGLSVIFAQRGLSELIPTLVHEDLHPPLYYVLLHFWMLLAGNSEWSVRLPSALSATLLVPLAFAVVREVSGEQRGMSCTWVGMGLAAAALVGTSPFIAYYAQETRMYSIAAALSLATTWAFLRAIRHPGLRRWLVFSCLLAASLYTQYFAAFLVPAFWLYALLFDRRALQHTVLGTLLAGLLYLPWLRPAYLQIGRLLRLPDYWITTRMSPRLFVEAIWTTLLPNTSTRLGLMVALVGIALLVHFVHQRKLRLSQRTRRTLLVALTFAIPLALTYGAVSLAPKFVARYTIVAAAPLYICATLALYPLLSHRLTWMRALFSLLIVLAVAASLPSTMAVLEGRQNTRDDTRELAAYLARHALANDALLLVENAPYALQYYYHGPTPQYGLHVGQDLSYAAQVLNGILRTQPRRVWLILWHREFADPADMVVTELMRVGREVDVEKQFHGYQLRAFDIQDFDQPIEAYPHPETTVAAEFSPGIRLLGFDRLLNDKGLLHYVLYWQALRPLEHNYSLTLTFEDMQGNEYLRRDQALSTDYFLPPAWPTDTPTRGRVDITLPADLPAFKYRVRLRVLNPETQRNLDLVDRRGSPLGQVLLLEEVALPKSALGSEPVEFNSPLHADTGIGLELLGFDLAKTAYSAGDYFRLMLWWRCQSTPVRDAPVGFRFLDSNNSPLWAAQKPITPGYPATQWQPQEINRAIYRLAIPSDLPGGDYLLQAGIEENWISLAELRIVAHEHHYDRPDMQQVLDLPFEKGITLLGYDLEAPVVQPGEETTVTLYWQAKERITVSYKVSVQMLSADQRIAAQDDSTPVHWTYPTTVWLPGEIVTDKHVLGIPPDIEPGRYTLIVVLYDEQSYERLAVEQAGTTPDHATLTTLHAGP